MSNNFTIPEYDYKSLYPYEKRLSSSQVLKYIESPSSFYVEYVLGHKYKGGVAMQTGAIFSAVYADRTFDYRKALELAGASRKVGDIFETAMKKLPVQKGGHPEYPLICKYRGWEFRASLDDYIAKSYTIIENKTGQTEWTQERVNFSQQITFQDWVHLKKKGVPARTILLNWLDLRKKDVCRIQSFRTSRSIKALEQFERLVDLVVDGIEAENFSKPVYN